MTYYRCDTTQAATSLCTLCVVTQSFASACTSTSSNNGGTTNTQSCSAYCDSGNCNSICDTAQTLCSASIGHQYIKDHDDVGAFPGKLGVEKDDIISQIWTIDFFTTLNNKLLTAEQVGLESQQGSAGSINLPHSGDPITHTLYNEVEVKLSGFVDGEYEQVALNDIITAARANAISSAYNNAKFKPSVCDVCNTAQHIGGNCDCNCSCPCSCSCGCDCPCSCPCDCDCPCHCNCSCGPSCSSNN